MPYASRLALLNGATDIRNETADRANTAIRVGDEFAALIKSVTLSTSPQAYGALGDGTTNDATGLQDAFTAAANQVVDLGGLTYKCNSELDLSSGMTLQNGTIDFTGMPASDSGLKATGTLAAAVNLTADLTYATRALTITSTTGLVAGDWLLIYSTALWGTISSGVIGEIARIKSVDSATGITLETPAHSTYATAASAAVQKLNLEYQNITLRNVRLIGAGAGQSQKAAVFTHCTGIVVENCRFEDFDNALLEFYGSVNCRATLSEFREAKQTGVAYGVLIQRGCRDVDVSHNHFSYMRHGVTIGGSGWVNRYIKANNNHVDYCADAGMDSHTNAQFVEFCNNTIVCSDAADIGSATDGIIVQCADFVVSGNIVRRPMQTGIWWQNLVEGHPTFPSGIISGNEVIEPGTQGIYVQNAGQDIKGLNISDNVVTGVRGTGTGGIYVFADDFDITRAVVSGNVLTGCQNHGITMRGSTGVMSDSSVEGNVIEVTNAVDAVDGLRLLTCSRVSVKGNTVEVANTARSGIVGSDATLCIITDNEVTLPGGATGSCVNLSGTGAGFVIEGNRGVNGANGIVFAATITASTIGLNDWSGCTAALSLSTGAGHKLAQIAEVSADKGNAAFTVRHDSEETILFNTPIDADRAVTTPSANVKRRIRVVRGAGATGAFNVNVGTGPLKALAAAGEWCVIESNGTAYVLTAYGAL